jgi:hypothetical protein
MVKMIQTRADPADQGSGRGHEDQFPLRRLSARYWSSEETLAGVHESDDVGRGVPYAVMTILTSGLRGVSAGGRTTARFF